MLIKYTPKIEHLKCIVLTPSEGLTLERNMVRLLPGTNEITNDEWKAMRGNIASELETGEITILAQKVGDGRGKPGGRKAKNLVDMPVNIAVKYVSECNNPETLQKWYKEITKEEVRLAITKRMKALEVETPEDEIPEAPNASPMTLDEFDNDSEDEDLFDDDFGADAGADAAADAGEKDFSKMSVKKLKEECEKIGIKTNGLKKEELIEALKNSDEE